MSDVQTAVEQGDVRQAFESAANGPWTVLYQSRKDGDLDVLQWSMLAPKSLRSDILADINRLPRLGFGAPGFSQIHDRGHERTQYEKFGTDESFEPLVILQDHYGVRPEMTPQLSEEFRLYHNLWTNDGKEFIKVKADGSDEPAARIGPESVRVRTPLLRQFQAAKQLDLVLRLYHNLWTNDGKEFIKVKADGSDEPAARIGPESVRVRTPLLRQFQAAKQLDLVLRISSYQYVDDPDEVAQFGEIVSVNDKDNMSISIHVGDALHDRQRPCSVLDGTKVVPAPPLEKAGVWPFDEREEVYHDFIIGEDADGEPVKHTCDPEQLGNYAGKNPDAPHYLTPVYFRREVLKRYYEHPAKYSMRDGYLSCGSLWGTHLDNNHPDHVMVFLGDLGRDLPESERTYWQTFNMAPTGPPSETLVRRAFLGQWANPQAPDLRFKSAYDRFNKKWQEQFGWALFKEPEPDDAHVLQRLRVPLDDSQPEFEAQVAGLAKVLVDALNEREIQKQLPTKEANDKGISKLERWMREQQYASVEHDIAFLRRLQRLRSKLAAHRKGSDYAQVLADANVDADLIQEVARMLFDAEHLLCSLASHFGIDLDSY